MDATKEQMIELSRRLSARSASAPRQVMHAVHSLLGGRTARHLVVSMEWIEQPREANSQPKGVTTWRAMALTDDALVTVTAESHVADWDFGTSDRGEFQLDATLYPLAQVASCSVTEIVPKQNDTLDRGIDNHAWDTKWSVRFRDGSSFPVPWSEGHDSRRAHEELAQAVTRVIAPK